MEHKMPERLKLTRKQMEQRRLMTVEDLSIGMKQADVARKYGVNRSNVSRWTKKLKKEGEPGLQMRKAKGAEPKLNLKQRESLIEILVAGAKNYGFKTDLWTGKRVCKVIKKEFGVSYHFKHIPKLLRGLDFRLVKPKRQANEKK
jgi:transposase